MFVLALDVYSRESHMYSPYMVPLSEICASHPIDGPLTCVCIPR